MVCRKVLIITYGFLNFFWHTHTHIDVYCGSATIDLCRAVSEVDELFLLCDVFQINTKTDLLEEYAVRWIY